MSNPRVTVYQSKFGGSNKIGINRNYLLSVDGFIRLALIVNKIP